MAELRCHLRASQRRRLVWAQPKSEGPEAGQSWENLGRAVCQDSPPLQTPLNSALGHWCTPPSDIRLGPPAVLPASTAPTVRAPLPAAGPIRPELPSAPTPVPERPCARDTGWGRY